MSWSRPRPSRLPALRPGTRTIKHYRATYDGSWFGPSLAGTACTVTEWRYNNYVEEYDEITEPATSRNQRYNYRPISFDVSNWRTQSNGCIEERDTYEITDYDNVDFSQALDLNIDLVPDPGDPRTQWRPIYPSLVYDRAFTPWGGSWSVAPVMDTGDEYIRPDDYRWSTCPTAARKLAEMTPAEVDSYLSSLTPGGNTYHDIGMIWGGRLLSPTGLFAAENSDRVRGVPTNRHLIFLTDGETQPRDLSYNSYGVEPLDGRRWTQDSPLTLTEVIEKRFGVACNEVRKRNVTIWVIGFGTTLTPVMTECAGPGHFFNASNASELTDTFTKIARQMTDLRIVR